MIDPFILFPNEEYFGVNPPKRLLYHSQAVREDWHEADRMTIYITRYDKRCRVFSIPRDTTTNVSSAPGSFAPGLPIVSS